MADASMTLKVDAEGLRGVLEKMVDELVERATKSLDMRVRMIVREEMDMQVSAVLKDHAARRA